MKLPPIITHEKLEVLREQLKAKGLKEFLAFKEIRYALFRMQTFAEGGCSPEAVHLDIAKEFEKQTEQLGGFKSFAINWDINPLTGKVIRRDKSIWEAHDEFMEKAAVQLKPVKKKAKVAK